MGNVALPSLSDVGLFMSSNSRYPSFSPSSLRNFRFLPFSFVSLPPFREVFLTFYNVKQVKRLMILSYLSEVKLYF